MQSTMSTTHELGRRGRRPIRRGVDIDGSDSQRALTFTSSLSIPAPGSLSLPKTTPLPTPLRTPEPPPNELSVEPSQPARRAPRKSKMDAIAAISRASSPPSSILPPSAPSAAPKLPSVLRPIPHSAELDLSSLPAPPVPSIGSTSGAPRLFGLDEVPVYHPTSEEFKDPMAYISSISSEAEKFGLCKIVPPSEWKMPFVTNTKTFRFRTRVQRLNAIEASSRAKLNFLEQLYRFHDQSLNRPTIPTISHKPVDLWILRKEVHKRDGYDIVTRNRLWGDIGRAMGYDNLVGISTQLKNAYSRIIHPFDEFVAQVRGTAASNPAMQQKYSTRSSAHSPVGMRASTSGSSSSSRPPNSSSSTTSGRVTTSHTNGNSSYVNGNGTTRSSSESSVDQGDSKDGVKTQEDAKEVKHAPVTPMKSSSPSALSSPSTGRLNAYALPLLDDALKGENCEICRAGTDDLHMLLCDGCDRGFHTYCINPPIASIPKGQWFCHACLFDSDYGFDEGEDHSLSSFQKRAADFKKMWFDSHPPSTSSSASLSTGPRSKKISNGGKVAVSEDDVEKEFWRLIESPYDSVEVEYGADIHSTTHGSAMPTMERHPTNPYSKDPWNLNNMPILPNSLLRYIKSDISGMTVPWTYVGMVFSTFCWHNEDHYTYSVNYMHWGDTKTWYAIPGSDAAKFEAAIKSEAPELFEAQPDLLFQLVTLMNPGRLREAGVKVYAANQRAGEFVVTFPQAYHAGFNHGFNFNEAVNFALPEWLDFDRSCVRRYQEHQKPPVFSHDELLMTITQYSPTVSTATWLLDSLTEMKDRELASRRSIRETLMDYEEFNHPEDHPEEQYQCSVCKTFCYLAQVKCVCTDSVACLEHYASLCICENPASRKLTLRTRFTDEEILTTHEEVAERRELPRAWQQRLRDCIESNPRPSLKPLRQLLVDADEAGAPEEEVRNLENFITRADTWVGIASTYLVRKTPARKRGRKSKGAPEPEPLPEQEYSLDDARVLLAEIENIGFESPELTNLTAAYRQTQALHDQVLHFLELSVDERELETGEVLVSDCKASLLSFPEAAQLDEAVEFLKLLRELDQVDDSSLTLDYVQELLDRAEANKMDRSHEYYVALVAKRDAGLEWKEKAETSLKNKGLTISDIWDIINPIAGTPTVEKTRNALQAAWSKAKEMEKTAKAIMSTHRDKRSTPEEALALINRAADFNIPVMTELGALARRGVKFSTIYKSIIKGTYQGDDAHPLSRLFFDLMEWRTEIKRDLWMLRIPAFYEVDEQLTQHERWLETHPWWEVGPFPPISNKPFSKAFDILQDVIYETRRFDQDMPTQECTCICTSPVEVKPNGQAAVQCDSCGAKFHEKCISGSCPFCDHHHWDGKIVKKRNFSLQDLQVIYNVAPDLSRSYSAFAKLLSAIISSCHSFSKHMDAFIKTLRPNAHSVPAGVIAKIRHIMRKLYTIQFRWPQNGLSHTTYGAELAVLHRTLAAKPVGNDAEKLHIPIPLSAAFNLGKPKLTFSCEMTPPGSDGCQCVCEKSVRPTGQNKHLLCTECKTMYHRQCVADLHRPVDEPRWKCPVCAGKQGQVYPDRQLRVRYFNERDANKFVDYINWILRRSPTMPMIRLPDPRPNEPVVTLTIMKWTQTQNTPSPQANSQAFKRKPGRPPTKRLNDPPNGVPTPVPNSSKVSDLGSQTTVASASDTPGSDSPRSNSPHISSTSASVVGETSSLTEISIVRNGINTNSDRLNGSSSTEPQTPYKNYLPIQIPPRSNGHITQPPVTVASLPPAPSASASDRAVSESESDARKRRISDAALASQPVAKAAKLDSDTLSTASIRSISPPSIHNTPVVVAPRIEALVSATQAS